MQTPPDAVRELTDDALLSAHRRISDDVVGVSAADLLMEVERRGLGEPKIGWSAADDAELARMYGTVRLALLAPALRRTQSSVARRASKLGLTKSSR